MGRPLLLPPGLFYPPRPIIHLVHRRRRLLDSTYPFLLLLLLLLHGLPKGFFSLPYLSNKETEEVSTTGRSRLGGDRRQTLSTWRMPFDLLLLLLEGPHSPDRLFSRSEVLIQ